MNRPRIPKEFKLYVNGQQLVGTITSVTLPQLTHSDKSRSTTEGACPHCGTYVIDPLPGSDAKLAQDIAYAHWRAEGRPAHVPGTPCWYCEPGKAAKTSVVWDDSDLPF